MLNSVRFPSLWSSWEGQDFCRIFWSGNWWSPNCQSSRASEFTRERHQSVQTVRTLNVNELNKNKTKAAIFFSFKLFILSCSESGSARCLSRSRSQDSSVAPCCEQVCRMGKGTLRDVESKVKTERISWDQLEKRSLGKLFRMFSMWQAIVAWTPSYPASQWSQSAQKLVWKAIL